MKQTFVLIDRKSPDILAALRSATVYKKFGEVLARPAAEGEQIETILGSGVIETKNTAKDGDWIVKNPSGEQYIISPSKFRDRYAPTSVKGVYKSRGSCRAIQNPFGHPIEIMASWGSPQTGDADCMIADTCDENGENMGGEPYLIEAAAFSETYK